METHPISEIMTSQVHHIDVNSNVIDARNLMEKYEIHHLPVLEQGKLVGLLSWNDLKQVEFLCEFIGDKIEEGSIFKSLSIEELMTENVHFLEVDATTEQAVQIFSNASFHCLPIMDKGDLVGMVTTKDVFSSFLTSTNV